MHQPLPIAYEVGVCGTNSEIIHLLRLIHVSLLPDHAGCAICLAELVTDLQAACWCPAVALYIEEVLI